MKVNKARFAFTLFLLCIILLFVATAFAYDPKAKMIPLIIGVAALILIVPILINEVHPLAIVKKMELDFFGNFSSGSPPSHGADAAGTKKLMLLFSWIIGFFIIIFLFGFHIGILVFTFAFLKIEGRFRWRPSMIAAAVTCGTIYVMFELAMGFRLFKGLLWGEIIPHI